MTFFASAVRSANDLDVLLASAVIGRKLEPAKKLFFRLRSYLVEQCRSHTVGKEVYGKIRLRPPDHQGMALITLGPAFDKGPSAEYINFNSGARLSFSIATREDDGGSRLVSFRFHLQFAECHCPEYLRFDLNPSSHSAPLNEPICHLHPGMEDIRLPMPILHPTEILDRIFFVIEPCLVPKKNSP